MPIPEIAFPISIQLDATLSIDANISSKSFLSLRILHHLLIY